MTMIANSSLLIRVGRPLLFTCLFVSRPLRVSAPAILLMGRAPVSPAIRYHTSAARMAKRTVGSNFTLGRNDKQRDDELQETSWYTKSNYSGPLQCSIDRNVAMRLFLQRVYLTAGAGVGLTLTAPALGFLFAPHLVMNASIPLLLGGLVCGLGGSIALGFTKYSINATRTVSYNSAPRQLSFVAVVGGMSAMLMPFAATVHEISPTIWPMAAGLSFATMGAATLWARTRPVGSLLRWEGPLFGGLIALVGNGLIAMLAHYFFPGSGVAQALHSVDMYGGIVLFTAMTAYETHRAVEMFERGDPDHLGCATSVYLDFVNLLIRIAELLAKTKQNK